MAKYKIKPETRGWVLYIYNHFPEHPQWVQIGSYDSEEKAEEAMMRAAKGKEKLYDENGEAV